MRWLLVFMVGISACAPPPCELEQLVDCPDCGTGELRSALTTQPETRFDAVVIGDKVICLICAKTWVVAADGTTAEIVFDIGPNTQLASAAGVAGGEFYVVADQGPPPPQGDEPSPTTLPTNYTVLALDSDNHNLWTLPLTASLLAAGVEGPYLLTTPTQLTALGADSGSIRWQADIPASSIPWTAQVTPDGTGGVYVATSTAIETQGTTAAQLALLDDAGTMQFTRTISTTIATPRIDNDGTEAIIEQIATTTDGGIVAVGRMTGDTIDFGDLQVPITGAGSFIAAFDATGATKWAHEITLADLSIAVTADALLVSGDYTGDPGVAGLTAARDSDVAVEVFDSTGVMRSAYQIGGTGEQTNRGIYAAVDGSAWVKLFDGSGEDAAPAEVDVGSSSFTSSESQLYVFDLAVQ